VFVSEPLRFVITATDPCFAAFNAKLRPAIPLPITTKSYSFMAKIVGRFCETPEPELASDTNALQSQIPSSQPDIIDQASFPEEHSKREQ
jgi:hypothetical protein